MTFTRDQKTTAIEAITDSKRLQAACLGRDRVWRRERVWFMVETATHHAADDKLSRRELKQLTFADYREAGYGSPLLMFLLFNLIWYLIEKYLLD